MFFGTCPRISLYQLEDRMGLKVNEPTIRAGGRGEAENDMARLTALMEELQLEAAVGPGVKGTWEDG